MLSHLLEQYKHLIDLNDNMQKSNLKFVEGYIGRQRIKNKDWEKDCVEFLKDAIDLQKTLLRHIQRHSLLMN